MRAILRKVEARSPNGPEFALREKPMKKTLTNGHAGDGKGRKLRSSEWFNNPHNPGMTALYL